MFSNHGSSSLFESNSFTLWQCHIQCVLITSTHSFPFPLWSGHPSILLLHLSLCPTHFYRALSPGNADHVCIYVCGRWGRSRFFKSIYYHLFIGLKIKVNWLKLKQQCSQGANMSKKLTLPLGLKLLFFKCEMVVASSFSYRNYLQGGNCHVW